MTLRDLVYEKGGKLVFPKHPPNAHLLALSRQKPEPDAVGSEAINKQRPWKFSGTLKLPDDYGTREGRIVYTPDHWERVGIDPMPTGKRFQLVHIITRTPFSLSDLTIYGLPALKTSGLTLDAAKQNGALLERAMVKHHAPAPSKKSVK